MKRIIQFAGRFPRLWNLYKGLERRAEGSVRYFNIFSASAEERFPDAGKQLNPRTGPNGANLMA